MGEGGSSLPNLKIPKVLRPQLLWAVRMDVPNQAAEAWPQARRQHPHPDGRFKSRCATLLPRGDRLTSGCLPPQPPSLHLRLVLAHTPQPVFTSSMDAGENVSNPVKSGNISKQWLHTYIQNVKIHQAIHLHLGGVSYTLFSVTCYWVKPP